MKAKLAIGFLSIFLMLSCKKEAEKTETTDVKTETASPIFKVTVDVNVKKDDSFHVYYTEDGSIDFTEENSIWAELKGSANDQQVVFNFPENTIPTQLRLDLGTNKDQEQMQIKNFKMEYAGKTFEAKGSEFFKYFVPNELNAKVDKAQGFVTPVKAEKYYGPSFYPQEALAPEIGKLVK